MDIQINRSACTGCSYCTVICPTEAISLQIHEAVWPEIEDSRCVLCGECLYICPNNVFSAPQYAAPQVEIDAAYDVVIVGAGIGGLMTGAGLAKAGKKTLIIEQLSFVGGKYTHLNTQDGYAVSTAAWTCPGPNSRIGKLSRKLGAQIRWITVHDVPFRGDHWVVMKDGRRFSSLDEAQETLVGGASGMARVFRWIADMYQPGRAYPDEMTTRQYIQKFIPGNTEYEQYVETIITHCFASQTVDYFSAMETKRAIVDSIEQMADWGTAAGGTAAIVAGLEKVFLERGGHIALKSRVVRIDLEGDRAVGVILADGRRVRAAVVIHNGGLNRLIQLVGEKNLPPAYLSRLQGAKPANVAALILATNRPLLGEKHSLLHAMGWERTLNCYAPTFFDPHLAPPDRHVLDVFWVMQPPYNHRRELDVVEAQLRQIFPDFDQAVEKTIPMFFSGQWTAEMAHCMGQSGADRLDPQTPIKDLYLVGYDCTGYGMAGDIIPHGVEHVLHLVLGDPAYAPEDEKASNKLKKWGKSWVFRFAAAAKSLSAHR